jgi:hypothetical protein
VVARPLDLAEPPAARPVHGCFRAKHGENPLAQHVEVVNIAKGALQSLEIHTPSRLLFWQKTFHQVTKAF